MKRVFNTLVIICLTVLSFGNTSEFSYDKAALNDEFQKLDMASTLVDQSNSTYNEISTNPIFEGNLKLTNTIGLKPAFSIDDMDWNAFAWGFCCWPVGFFMVAIDSDSSKDEKFSFWIGLAANIILLGGGGGGYLLSRR